MEPIKPEIQVVEDATELSRKAAEVIVQQVTDALHFKTFFTIALSGGSTPKTLYSLLADDDSIRSQIPWDRINIFWGDERHVPPDHPESNYLMAQHVLLAKVPIPPDNIYRVRAEDPDAGKSATLYEQELCKYFKLKEGELPRFDCVLLGMGTDGHTASLFPGTAALKERNRLVVANWIDKFQTYRITFTHPVLNNADTVIFLISGEKKASILREILEGEKRPDKYPSQLIQPKRGRLLWLVDKPAASRLQKSV